MSGATIVTWPTCAVSPGCVSSQLPPPSAERSTITAPAFMPATCDLLMSLGEGRPGMAAVVMIRSDCWICLVSDGVDLGFLRRGQFARVAALAARIDAGLDECGAQRSDLFRGLRANVIALDDGAQTMRGGNRLKAGDTEAHDQNFGRPDRAGGRGDLRQDAGEMGRAELHRVIARQGGLARQRVHRLRPRDARDTLHGEAGDLLVQQALDQRRLLVRIDERDQDRAFLHRVDHIQRRGLHGENHVGVGDQLLAIVNEGDILERGVGQLDGISRARLHVQFGAELDQLGDDGRHQRHAPFVRMGFLQNGDVDDT